jgi:hypothetical protein
VYFSSWKVLHWRFLAYLTAPRQETMLNERKDQLLAQKVEVALVFQQMLGTADAQAYLVSSGVPADVIERVLFSTALRRSQEGLRALTEQDRGHLNGGMPVDDATAKADVAIVQHG